MKNEKNEMEIRILTKSIRKCVRELLHEQKMTITFIKKDGTERKMLCTLAENKIPSEKTPKKSGKTQSDDSIAVFDLEKQDWRSFRWDSVKKIGEINFSQGV